MGKQMTNEALTPQLLRIAFVYEWSDAFINRILSAAEARKLNPAETIKLAATIAEAYSLSELRNQPSLVDQVAKLLNFATREELETFSKENPPLHLQWNAAPAPKDMIGRVAAMSMTEIVIEEEYGHTFFCLDRARGYDGELTIGATISVDVGRWVRYVVESPAIDASRPQG